MFTTGRFWVFTEGASADAAAAATADAAPRQVTFEYMLGPDDVGCAAGGAMWLDIYAGTIALLENAECDDQPRTVVTPPGEHQVEIAVWDQQLWVGTALLAEDDHAIDIQLTLVSADP